MDQSYTGHGHVLFPVGARQRRILAGALSLVAQIGARYRTLWHACYSSETLPAYLARSRSRNAEIERSRAQVLVADHRCYEEKACGGQKLEAPGCKGLAVFARGLINVGFKVHYFNSSEFIRLAQLVENIWEELNKLIAYRVSLPQRSSERFGRSIY